MRKWYNPFTWFRKSETFLRYDRKGLLYLITKEQNFVLTVKNGKYSLDIEAPTVSETQETTQKF